MQNRSWLYRPQAQRQESKEERAYGTGETIKGIKKSEKARRIKGTGGTERTDRKAIIPADDKKQRTGVGYAFPGERAACYSSDLILRQYSRIKGRKENGSTYKKLQNVYTIVLIENSSADFHKIAGQYIHRSSQVFDTGLKLNLLQKYIFVALDVFREITYNLDEEIEAWLLFLSSDRPEDIMRIIERYPDFCEIYEEIAQFQVKPEELVGMYSKALEILDRNTVQYMIEEQKQEIEGQKQEIERLTKQARIHPPL